MAEVLAQARRVGDGGGGGGVRPRVGLKPKAPQHEAGMRIEPPPSPPLAMGRAPAATSAAAPPDEPPEARSGAQGVPVGRAISGSVNGVRPSSGDAVRATKMSPASR